MNKYIYLDTETGGLFPAVHALLSIGAVSPDGDSFRRFITVESQPGKSVDPAAVQVNGYTPEEWARRGALPLPSVMEALREWLAGHPGLPIVAHNAGFDQGFLLEAERVTGVVVPHRYGWRCTMRLLQELMDLGLVPEGSARLDRLAELAGVGIDRGAAHDALVDAMVTRAGHEWLQGRIRAALAAGEMGLEWEKGKVAQLLRRAKDVLQAAWPVVTEAALGDQNDAEKVSDEGRPLVADRYAAKAGERFQLSRQMVALVKEIEGMQGDGVDRADLTDKVAQWLRRAKDELQAAWPVVEDAEQEALQKAALHFQNGSLKESERWGDVAKAFMAQGFRIQALVKEMEGMQGDGVDRADRIDEVAAVGGEGEGGAA